MDSLSRDIFRLTMILDLPTAQEALAPVVHIKDFMRYYFTRFMSNLTSSFKTFNSSEIQDYNLRHKDKIAALLKRPIVLDGIIVAIPRGMVKSYSQTLHDLTAILEMIRPETLKSDVQDLITVMNQGKPQDLKLPHYTKPEFDDAKHAIGRLFGKVGLEYSTAPVALTGKAEIGNTNLSLIDITKRYYPDVLSLNILLKSVEATYGKTKWSDSNKVILSQALMNLAYRLSIFATIMERVQEVEHCFIRSIDVVLKTVE